MTFVLEVFMNIIIVGCGKVGYTLVEQLGGENHNITVIDTNEEKVNSITDDLDAMGIVVSASRHCLRPALTMRIC